MLVIFGVVVVSSAFKTEIAETTPQPVARGFHVVSATLAPVPQAYDGPCPVTFNFEGKITVRGRGSVRYTFVRSDGATGPEYSLDFNGERTLPVSTTWTLSTPVLEGWQSIKILSPTEMESNRAFFKGKCTGAEAEQFRVTEATLKIGSVENRGPCPVTVRFGAYITTNGAGVVKYTFTRSDGASAPVQTLAFDAAGWKRVETTWTLGGPELPHFVGWEAIKVLSPNEMVDYRKFEVVCAKR